MSNLFLRIGRFIFRKLGLSESALFRNEKHTDTLSLNEGNDFIRKIIIKGDAAMISRFGAVESNCWINYEQINSYKEGSLLAALKGMRREWDAGRIEALSNNAGFFPLDDESLNKYAECSFESIRNIDAVGIWEFVPGESYFIKKLCPHAAKLSPLSLEPYFFEDPWSASLAGKKVLVIHPFAASIEQQYQKRELLFQHKEMLPAFELRTVKAVQSIAGNKTSFSSWFEALDFMKQQIDNCDFDIALIGAGSYGLPLASYVKQKGKIAVHMGGSLQILFGIKGRRWDDHEVISKLYNEHWIRPSEEETVAGASKVEGGCYW